ncbi:MAG: diacylglycerol kinase family lipid kinase [Clostridia bacterium]|nr:diacylglycerol kinase family lipid kinase [Clostridia bacterium]
MLNIIINPTAGRGKAAAARTAVDKAMSEAGALFRFHETRERGEAREISARLTAAGETEIIAMGGDGTAHEVLNGLKAPGEVCMGLIPCDSGNDFAAAARIPADPAAAARLILEGRPLRTDYLDCSGVRGLNVIGTGIDVDILRRSYRARFLKGSLNYFASLLSSVCRYTPGPMAFKSADREGDGRAFILCACNGSQFGGGISICPVADIGDGELDVVLVRAMPRWRTPAALVTLMSKRILEHDQTLHMRSDRLKADFREPVTIQIDGELYDRLPFDVRVVPGGLMMYRPGTAGN